MFGSIAMKLACGVVGAAIGYLVAKQYNPNLQDKD